MYGFLLDHERDTLIAPCRHWTDRLSDDEVIAIAAAILDVFESWKLRQADANGQVNVPVGALGLLGGGGGLLDFVTTETVVPHGDVEPWQCAGPFVKNDIDLAFTLWLDNDPDFAALIADHRLWDVFSIVGLWSVRTAAPESLCRLNGLLVNALLEDAKNAEEYWQLLTKLNAYLNAKQRRQMENLANARAKRNETRSEKADELHQSLRTAAFDYLLMRPLASNDDELIPFLREHGFGSLEPSTIARLIAGVRGEVKQHLKSATGPRTDLYATSQRRND